MRFPENAGSIEASTATLREGIRVAVAAAYVYIDTPAFRGALNELWALPEELRHEYVDLVFMDADELERRRITPPDDIHLQRSEFSDQRPTLFCVTKKLPPGLGWQKITITFDNNRPETFVPIDRARVE